MATAEQVAELRARFAAMQSGGARVLSNASLAIRVLDAMDSAAPVEPTPDPDPEPAPEPDPDPEPTPDPEPDGWTRPATMPTRADTGWVGAGSPALTTWTGPRTITDSDITLEGYHFPGEVAFEGDNVTVRGCTVDGQMKFRQGSNYVAEYCDAWGFYIIGSDGATVRRCYTTGHVGTDGSQVKAPSSGSPPARDVVIEDCCFENATVSSGSHYDGIQASGTVGLTIRGCAFLPDAIPPSLHDRQTAAIFLENRLGGNRDVTITGNWIAAVGYRTLFLFGEGITVTDNIFLTGYTDPAAGAGSGSAFVESGNVTSDGTPVTLAGG